MSVPRDREAFKQAQRMRAGSLAWCLIERGGADGVSDAHVTCTVVKHGRDKGGPYTEVRMPDGSTERVHRARLSPTRGT